jgi:hypothetical protein
MFISIFSPYINLFKREAIILFKKQSGSIKYSYVFFILKNLNHIFSFGKGLSGNMDLSVWWDNALAFP